MRVEKLHDFEIQGLALKPECKIPAIVGKLKCVVRDRKGNCSRMLEIRALLALTDEVPLILGFKDLLSEFKVCFNYQKREAYLEEV